MTSLSFASIFVPLFKTLWSGEAEIAIWGIHVDVGERNTKNMIKEVVGMVTGNGYVAKTKTLCHAASYVADKKNT